MFCHPLEIFKNKKLAEQFKCPLNLGILNQPLLDQCGHSFCKQCIKKYLINSSKCPISEKIILDSNLKDNNLAQKVINKLMVFCTNEGCEWEGKLESLDEHLKQECLYEEFYCSNFGCSEKVIKKNKIQHETNCVYKIVICEHCKIETTVRELKNHYLKCPKMSVCCENRCKEMITRENMHQHLKNECQNTIIRCPVPLCDSQEKRKNIMNHLYSSNGYIKHISLLNKRIIDVKQKTDEYENIIRRQENLKFFKDQLVPSKEYLIDDTFHPEFMIIDCWKKMVVQTQSEIMIYICLDKNLNQIQKYQLRLSILDYFYIGVGSWPLIKEFKFIHSKKFTDDIFLIKISSQNGTREEPIDLELIYETNTKQIIFFNKNSGRKSSLIIGQKQLDNFRVCFILPNKGDYLKLIQFTHNNYLSLVFF